MRPHFWTVYDDDDAVVELVATDVLVERMRFVGGPFRYRSPVVCLKREGTL